MLGWRSIAGGGQSMAWGRGDLFAISVLDRTGQPYLLASFHGDTNGLATLPVIRSILAVRARPPQHLTLSLEAQACSPARRALRRHPPPCHGDAHTLEAQAAPWPPLTAAVRLYL